MNINGKEDTKAYHGEVWGWTSLIKAIVELMIFGWSKDILTNLSRMLAKDQGMREIWYE